MFRRFLMGRYGNDRLNFAIVILSLLCGIMTFFVSGVADLVFSLLQLMLLGLWAMRSLSRNFYARRKENQSFLRFWDKCKRRFSGISGFFSRLKDTKHKYFKCPNCKSRLRVPKGRGEITVTCPRCRNRFDKKS